MPNSIAAASVDELVRLVSLFPVDLIRDRWPEAVGSKDEMALQAVADRNVNLIAGFVAKNLNCCHQHVYVYEAGAGNLMDAVPENVLDGSARIARIESADSIRLVYALPYDYKVIVRQPALQELTLRFLWPVSFTFTGSTMVARLVKMNKDYRAYVKDRVPISGSAIRDERTLLGSVLQAVPVVLSPSDLNKGIKAMWAADDVDAQASSIKLSSSTRSDRMDTNRLIKRDLPELYEKVIATTILNASFLCLSEALSVERFGIKPSFGEVNFPLYSGTPDATEGLLRALLEANS